MNAPPVYRELVCLHEAGHAVAAWALGIRVDGVCLGQGSYGGVTATGERNPLDRLLVSLGGLAAEALLGPFAAPDVSWSELAEGDFRTPADRDIAAVGRLATELWPQSSPEERAAFLVERWEGAKSLVAEHELAIRRLAEELDANERLGAEVVGAILEDEVGPGA